MNVDNFFTLPNGDIAKLYTLTNRGGATVQISDFGATIITLNVPDKAGKMVDVMLGYQNAEDYLENPSFQGALVGRVANRIKNAEFTLNGRKYTLIANKAPHSLHGGLSYAHRLWSLKKQTENSLELTLISPDGDAGYPGTLSIKVTYTLEDDNTLSLEMRATTDALTIVNLTNHSYFNLSGEDSGSICDHEFAVYSNSRQEVEPESLVPTGKLLNIIGTSYDFNTLKSFDKILEEIPEGVDNSFVFENSGNLTLQATAISKTTGIRMDVYSTDCALQFYTGCALDGTEKGKSGKSLNQFSAFCFETQHLVDSPNNPQFPTINLEAGEEYFQKACYKFSIEK